MKSYDELNGLLLDRCVAYAKAHPHPEQADRTVWEMFEAERAHLVPHAGRFDRLPRAAGIGLEDLPGSLRQQQVLGQRQRRWATCRDPGLCRSRGDPPGRPHRRRTSSRLRPRRHHLRSLALRAGPRPQARRACATVPRSRTGCCRRRSIASAASSPAPTDGDRQMAKILATVLSDGLVAVESACAEALAEGVSSADVIINIVSRRSAIPRRRSPS